MTWVEELHDANQLKRCIRDLVALSTLTAMWKEYAPHQIMDSIAAAMVSMLGAEAVYVRVSGLHNEPEIQMTRVAHPALAASSVAMTKALQDIRLGPTEQTWVIKNPLAPGKLRVAAVPIGIGRNAALIAGSADPAFPTEIHRLLLGIASNDTTIALQRWQSATEQRRLIALIERSSDFVGVADLDGKPRYLNAAALEFAGLSGLAQTNSLNVFDFLAPDEGDRARSEVMPLVMQTGRWFGELGFRNFNTGEVIPFLVECFRIDDARSGRPINIATVGRELRSQRKLEADLRRLNETLERRVDDRTSELTAALQRLNIEATERTRSDARAQALQLELFHASRLSTAGQMAAALAHELNQPLAASINSVNAARLLAAQQPLRRVDTLREVLDEAVAEALRAGEIIRRLRDFVTRGETDLRTENLSDLVREACHLAAGAARGARINMLLDEGADTVLVNKLQLQQVIVNLLRNAFEAMAQSSTPEVEVRTRRLDEATEIVIADRGPGLPREITEHLFEPFHTTKRDGMGLGLSICRTIVEAHGGRLTYHANPAGGAVFRITIPLTPERTAKP